MSKLPHDIPLWIDPSKENYFITINCRCRGPNQLAKPEIAPGIFETVRFRRDQGLWSFHIFLLMPDHLHTILTFPSPEKRMKIIISKWKEWVAKQFRIQWQDDFFEHRLRRDESLDEKVRYILENPVRKGLVAKPEDWPFVLHREM